MPRKNVIIEISKEVNGFTEDYAAHTPANGKNFIVMAFEGSGVAASLNAVVKLVWDFGGAGETVLWTIKGNDFMKHHIDDTLGDGTKKLAVVLDNGEAGPVFMSGYCRILEEE